MKSQVRKFAWVIVVVVILAALCWGCYSCYVKRGAVCHPQVVEDGHETIPEYSMDGRPHAEAGNVALFDVGGMELPYYDSDDFVIFCGPGRYTILYDTLYRQAAWVAYLLTRDDVGAKAAGRRNKFIPDPEVVRRGYPTAHTSHYTNTGYDRGHLLPSADRVGCQEENDATFHLSNISPQAPALNRRVWKALEDQVRRWAERYDSVWVVTGGVLKPGLECINNGIGVPEHFYKVLLTCDDSKYSSVGFLLPNSADISGRFMDYAVTVDSVQRLTSYDFFHRLPDHMEEVVESAFDLSFWAL